MGLAAEAGSGAAMGHPEGARMLVERVLTVAAGNWCDAQVSVGDVRAITVGSRVVLSRDRTRRDGHRRPFVVRQKDTCELEMQLTAGGAPPFVRANGVHS